MSAVARNHVFSAVHTVGGLLPADMLVRVSEGKDVAGSLPADYGVIGARSVSDEAERHWDYLKSVWKELREQLPQAPQTEVPADPTGLAVSQWLAPLFHELGFGALTELGRSGITADDGGKAFAVSHRWNHVPVHLASWQVSLDKRPGGAGTVPAQSLVQECLNRTESHLWGVVSNGRQLRLLRDSNALATASYVEFDLEAIFDGELFSEFVLLYRLLQVTRFAVADGAAPSTCWLEKWRIDAIASGTRALDQLRDGVQQAITTLGTGFIKHPDNGELRATLDVHAFHAALLRLVYRMLFLFVAEDRGVLHSKEADQQARDRYAAYFSTVRLRAHARRRRGTAHDDLYRALRIVLDALGDDLGRPELGLPGLGGIFDDTDADTPLRGLDLANEYLLAAVRHLAQVRDVDSRRWRSVDYQHLGAEELGSIYESLLELVPKHSAVDRTFELVAMAGNSRKTTGSYYTPSSLIACLLDSTLDPVVDDAVKRAEIAATAAGEPDPADRIVTELLSLKVCDPACGSGHFLVAAARRIAKRVASVREHNPEPTTDAVRHALHEVIARCIYGVDLNPMAVELAKVSLWLEAMEPGMALSFLDAHIKWGNALIGATPALLRKGIPDEAFNPIEGDDKKFAKSLARRNKSERLGQEVLFEIHTETKVSNAAFAASVRHLMTTVPGELPDVRRQEAGYRKFAESAGYRHALHLADAWCAAFLWPKDAGAPQAVTEKVFRGMQDPDGKTATQGTRDEIVQLRDQYRFFHWHLEFPEVFSVFDDSSAVEDGAGWDGGFDCVLGNPPWEHLELKEQEFFSSRSPAIAAAVGNKRKKLIEALREENLFLYNIYVEAKRKVDGCRHFASNSRIFPLCGRGRIKTDPIFAEQGRQLIRSCGRMGMVLPTGIATDATTQYFFKELVQAASLAALYDFENAAPLFPGVHRAFKFCVLAITGRGLREDAATFAFFLHNPAELDDAKKAFTLAPEEITLLNPNTGTCPVFRSRRDAEITLGIYRRVPVLVEELDERRRGGHNPWGVSFIQGLFNMTSDSHLFRSREDLEGAGWTLSGNIFTKGAARMLPLYQGMMATFYDHRAADVVRSATAGKRQNQPRYLTRAEKRDPFRSAIPMYWVDSREVSQRSPWLHAFSDITSSTNERTMVSYPIPSVAVGNKSPLIECGYSGERRVVLLALTASFVFDFIARQKIGGTTLNFFYLKQMPVIAPVVADCHAAFITQRALELTYTAYDMAPFARELSETGAPFVWDDERRGSCSVGGEGWW